MYELSKMKKKPGHRLFTPLTVFSSLLFLMSASMVGAMPPHPDVIDKIERGEIEVPYHIQNRAALEASGLNSGGESILKKAGILAKPGVSGNFKILTLLVDFSDNIAQVNAVNFDTLVYVDVSGSVNNFYRENSYNNLSIVSPIYPSTLGWYRAPQTYSYYVNNQYGIYGTYPNNCQKLVEDLIFLADPFVDFSQFDNDSDGYVDGLIIAHAGPGAELTGLNTDIWSHKWGITPQSMDGVLISTYCMNPEYWQTPGDITLGVYCHELGHVLGLPDLYDYDQSPDSPSRGVGYWSLMAGGSWSGPSGLGGSPSHLDAWSKLFLSFLGPIVPSVDQYGVSFPQVETNQIIYKLWTNGAPGSEYFLVENRQQVGYDAFLPSSGMMIWHIDDNIPNNDREWYPGYTDSSHYKVALEQADGLWEMEHNSSSGDAGDPYPGSTVNRTFSGVSTPNSDAYSFAPTQVSVSNISNSQATMTADVIIGSPQDIANDSDGLLPERVRLLGNAPNPFNPETIINFEVTAETAIKLEIFSLTGQQIRTLADQSLPAGLYRLAWDGKDSMKREVSSGVYFYRLSYPGKVATQKMLKLK